MLTKITLRKNISTKTLVQFISFEGGFNKAPDIVPYIPSMSSLRILLGIEHTASNKGGTDFTYEVLLIQLRDSNLRKFKKNFEKPMDNNNKITQK